METLEMGNHFPTTAEEALAWTPIISRVALHSQILAVAKTRVEGAWAAYIAPVPGMNHDNEYQEVLRSGNKLLEEVARCLFPCFNDIPYAR